MGREIEGHDEPDTVINDSSEFFQIVSVRGDMKAVQFCSIVSRTD